MKLAIVGMVLIVVSIGFAGNWIYNPFAEPQQLEPFEPIPHYAENDPADDVYHSNITYIPSLNMSYIEYNYVWLNNSDHAPDTEEVRIFIKDGEVQYVSLRIHYEWMKITNYSIDGTHVHIHFMSVYHTPYVSKSSLFTTTLNRIIPIVIPLFAGMGLIYLDYKIIEISARAKIAKGFKKYSIKSKLKMIFGK